MMLTDEETARLFHDTYERLAPSFGYETRKETRKFDPSSPNGRLMIKVCGEVSRQIEASTREECAKLIESAIDERKFQNYVQVTELQLCADHMRALGATEAKK